MCAEPAPWRPTLLLLAIAGLALPSVAWAQQQPSNPNVPVLGRERPAYDALGVRVRSFFIYPSIEVGTLYDSNVFATNDDEEDDFAATLQPNILIRSNFSRHALSLEAGGGLARYFQESDADYDDFFARTAGRLDITRDDILSGKLEITRLHEDPSSPDEQGEVEAGDEVTTFLRQLAGLDYRRNFNRIFTVLGGEFSRLDYEDADDSNEDDRDRNQYLTRLRAGYALSPRLNVFTQGTYDIRRYDQTPDDEGRDLDSEAVGVTVGTEIDITSILFGEVGVGYTYRTYEDDELDTVKGITFGGSLTYNVTRLTSVILDLSGELRETTVVNEGRQASGNFKRGGSIEVQHELLRNVVLIGDAGFSREVFEATDRVDDTVSGGGGVSYLLNRRLSLEATYNYSTRSSDDEEEEFDRHLVAVGLTVKL